MKLIGFVLHGCPPLVFRRQEWRPVNKKPGLVRAGEHFIELLQRRSRPSCHVEKLCFGCRPGSLAGVCTECPRLRASLVRVRLSLSPDKLNPLTLTVFVFMALWYSLPYRFLFNLL